MDSNEFIDGDGRITAEEMKVFESFAAWNITDNMKEQLEDWNIAERMDQEIKAYLEREWVSDKSKAHVQALYSRVQERIGNGNWEATVARKQKEDKGWFWDNISDAWDSIADGFSSLWDDTSDAITTDKSELEAEWWKFATIEVNGENLEYRTKEKKDGTTDVYIDDNGTNTDIVWVPTDRVKDAIAFYKKTSENDMEMDDFSMDTVGKVFDNIWDYVAGDTLNYGDQNSNFRMYMDR